MTKLLMIVGCCLMMAGCVKKPTPIQTPDPISQDEIRKYNGKLPVCM